MIHLGAPIDKGDIENECPLVQAADNGDLALVQLLLDLQASDNWLAVEYAIDFCHVPVVLLLLSSALDQDIDNAFVYAVSQNNYTVAAALVDRVSDLAKDRARLPSISVNRSERVLKLCCRR